VLCVFQSSEFHHYNFSQCFASLTWTLTVQPSSFNMQRDNRGNVETWETFWSFLDVNRTIFANGPVGLLQAWCVFYIKRVDSMFCHPSFAPHYILLQYSVSATLTVLPNFDIFLFRVYLRLKLLMPFRPTLYALVDFICFYLH